MLLSFSIVRHTTAIASSIMVYQPLWTVPPVERPTTTHTVSRLTWTPFTWWRIGHSNAQDARPRSRPRDPWATTSQNIRRPRVRPLEFLYWKNMYTYVDCSFSGFVCDLCGFQTKTKFLLKTHQLTHNPVKKYQCDQCDKSFNFKYSFDSHRRMHLGMNHKYYCFFAWPGIFKIWYFC